MRLFDLYSVNLCSHDQLYVWFVGLVGLLAMQAPIHAHERLSLVGLSSKLAATVAAAALAAGAAAVVAVVADAASCGTAPCGVVRSVSAAVIARYACIASGDAIAAPSSANDDCGCGCGGGAVRRRGGVERRRASAGACAGEDGPAHCEDLALSSRPPWLWPWPASGSNSSGDSTDAGCVT